MANETKNKTPDYTLRAQKNYRQKHDYMNLAFDKGEPDAFRSVGITAAVMRDLIRAEYNRRINGGEVEETPVSAPATNDTDNNSSDDIPFFD